jgi:hypothetical protein
VYAGPRAPLPRGLLAAPVEALGGSRQVPRLPVLVEGRPREPGAGGAGKSDRRLHGAAAVRHEHLFPRAQLIRKLLGLEDPSPMKVAEILERLNIGVVVTVEEHGRLPPDGDECDPWERYRRAGIAWTDCQKDGDLN